MSNILCVFFDESMILCVSYVGSAVFFVFVDVFRIRVFVCACPMICGLVCVHYSVHVCALSMNDRGRQEVESCSNFWCFVWYPDSRLH